MNRILQILFCEDTYTAHRGRTHKAYDQHMRETIEPPAAVGRATHMTSICAKLTHRPQRSESNAQCNAMQCDHIDCLLLCHAAPITC